MPSIIECVPNFSEGRDKKTIESIAKAISSTTGCKLLDVDPGQSTNRTVYTFVGNPTDVVNGALNAAKVAADLIDMSRHVGEHPRMGALDVCPFIPVQNVTMKDCIDCAWRFARLLAQELDVPVYLYGEAAKIEERKLLPNVRSGEYEGLRNRYESEESLEKWRPDFGPAMFMPTWGATAVGARKFLLAYNVNLLATKEQAHRIALNIRENGRGPDKPGRLKTVQGIGWYLEEENLAQVSTNILDHDQTPLHRVYEECLADANQLDLAVVGSQIVGLVPLVALLQVADHYIERDSLFILEEDQKVRLAIDRLGLNSLGLFNPKQRIVEYMVDSEPAGPLCSMELADFVMTVGARSPSPGGGSVAALCAALGTALGTMVGFMTFGNRKFESLDGTMRQLLAPLYKACKDLVPLVDADASAFACYMAALKLPKSNAEEVEKRDQAIKTAMKRCIDVPFDVAETANGVWPQLLKLAEVGNVTCKSDLQVGAKALETAVFGAVCNVKINAENVTDSAEKAAILQRADNLVKEAETQCVEVLKIIDQRQ